jgi:tripartite-type tricarboxylate transporter receptor subunit TctC
LFLWKTLVIACCQNPVFADTVQALTERSNPDRLNATDVITLQALLPLLRRILLGLVGAAWVAVGQAQEAPALPRTVTLLVPYPAGGVTDTLARALAQRLAQTWGNTVLVDNKAGGGTLIGTAAAARAPADGSTLLLTSFGFIGNQLMLPSLPYAPASLTPLAMVGESAGVLFVHPSVPANNTAEFLQWMRTRGTPVAFASSGNGSSVHVMAEMLASAAGVPIIHVPYKGNAPALADLMGGQVQAMFDSLGALSHVKTGRLRALGVSTQARSALAPELPTLAESGAAALARFDAGSWFGVLVPAATPAALQTRLHADMAAVLATPAMKAEILKTGVEPRTMTQAEFAAYLKRQLETWGPVIRERNIRPD